MFFFTSGECLQMSLRPEAAIRLRESSGSWIHKTNKGTAPASTTAWDNSERKKKVYDVTEQEHINSVAHSYYL